MEEEGEQNAYLKQAVEFPQILASTVIVHRFTLNIFTHSFSLSFSLQSANLSAYGELIIEVSIMLWWRFCSVLPWMWLYYSI